jgi:DNA repair exonuclease SbcCD nuclease subunit
MPANTLRLCHLADVHLGYRRFNKLSKSGFNQREVDVCLAFKEALNKIIGLKPDITLIAGDLFHSVRPSNTVLTFAFRELQRLASDLKQPIVIVAGNHEAPRRKDTGCALRLLAEIPGVFVADFGREDFSFKELDLAVTCVPHPLLSSLEARSLRANEKYKYNVLLIHGQVDQALEHDYGKVELKLSEINSHEWDYIALGHVHTAKQVARNAAYSGALEFTSSNIWAEAGSEKGFWEVTLPALKKTFRSLTGLRQVYDLKPIDAGSLDAAEINQALQSRVENIPGGLSGKIVRLCLDQASREIVRALDYRKIREYRAAALNFTLAIRGLSRTTASSAKSSAAMRSIESELQAFCCGLEGQTKNKAADVEQTLLSFLNQVEAEHEVN